MAFDVVDHLADVLDFGEHAVDELLMAEAGIDRHHQHQVDVGEDFDQHLGRRGRVDRHADALFQPGDALDRAVQILISFPVDDERIGAGLGKGVDEQIGIVNHQVDFQRQTGHGPQRFDDRHSHGQVGNEVAVHHVDVDAIGSGRFGLGHLRAQSGKIGRQDRRSEFDVIVAHR